MLRIFCWMMSVLVLSGCASGFKSHTPVLTVEQGQEPSKLVGLWHSPDPDTNTFYVVQVTPGPYRTTLASFGMVKDGEFWFAGRVPMRNAEIEPGLHLVEDPDGFHLVSLHEGRLRDHSSTTLRATESQLSRMAARHFVRVGLKGSEARSDLRIEFIDGDRDAIASFFKELMRSKTFVLEPETKRELVFTPLVDRALSSRIRAELDKGANQLEADVNRILARRKDSVTSEICRAVGATDQASVELVLLGLECRALGLAIDDRPAPPPHRAGSEGALVSAHDGHP